MRRVHLRDCRDQGHAGDGFCAQAPASPAMRDGKEVAAHGSSARPKRNGSCIDWLLTEARSFPGSFSGMIARRAVVPEFRGKPRLRNRSFATIVRNYMTRDDEGCCCLTG